MMNCVTQHLKHNFFFICQINQQQNTKINIFGRAKKNVIAISFFSFFGLLNTTNIILIYIFGVCVCLHSGEIGYEFSVYFVAVSDRGCFYVL